ncbi:hypothetical protein RYA05_02210 [Pseudomonas syringae pv. actinidiae]|nr:hypothetical protein [Pseudomonas syringae pv. actinidiae]
MIADTQLHESLLAMGFAEAASPYSDHYRNGLILVRTLAGKDEYSVEAEGIKVVDGQILSGEALIATLGHFLRKQSYLTACVTEFASEVSEILAAKGLATVPRLEANNPNVLFFAVGSKVPLFQLIYKEGGEYDLNMETGFHVVTPDEVATSVTSRWSPDDAYYVSPDRMVIKTLAPACDFIGIGIACGINSIRHYFAKTWMTAGDEGMRHLLPRETNTVQVLEIILKNPLPV